MGPDRPYHEAQHRVVFSMSRDPHLCGCSCCKVEVDAFLAFKIPRLCSGRLPRLLLTIQLVACNAATPLAWRQALITRLAMKAREGTVLDSVPNAQT